jgi:hypothetical protein
MARARYLISFPGGAMDHLPEGELPAVGEAAHAVVREAMDAGVFIFAGGLDQDVEPVMVAADGTAAAGTYPETKELSGGFAVVDVPRGRQPWSGPRSSRAPVAVRKKSARSHETRSSDRTGSSFGGSLQAACAGERENVSELRRRIRRGGAGYVPDPVATRA